MREVMPSETVMPGGTAVPTERLCPRGGGPAGAGRGGAGRGRGLSMQGGRSTRSPALLLCPGGEEIGSRRAGGGLGSGLISGSAGITVAG